MIVNAGGRQIDHHHAGFRIALEMRRIFERGGNDAGRQAKFGVVGRGQRAIGKRHGEIGAGAIGLERCQGGREAGREGRDLGRRRAGEELRDAVLDEEGRHRRAVIEPRHEVPELVFTALERLFR